MYIVVLELGYTLVHNTVYDILILSLSPSLDWQLRV